MKKLPWEGLKLLLLRKSEILTLTKASIFIEVRGLPNQNILKVLGKESNNFLFQCMNKRSSTDLDLRQSLARTMGKPSFFHPQSLWGLESILSNGRRKWSFPRERAQVKSADKQPFDRRKFISIERGTEMVSENVIVGAKKAPSIVIVTGCDANPQQFFWGGTKCNKMGETLLQFLNSTLVP